MRNILLHGHIFKNAGTTLDWSLQNNFGKGFLDHREDQLMRADGRGHLAQLLSENQQLCAISSHHMTGEYPDLPDTRFIPVFLLRHPLVRIRSVYDFERKQRGSTPGSKAARELGFRDYVAWRMQPEVARTIRNYQTLYLAGHHRGTNGVDIACRYFPRALENLQNSALVGVVERYDHSMVVLEDSLRAQFPAIDLSYVVQNVSARKAGKAQHTEADDVTAAVLGELGDLQKTVIDQNSFDLALYQVALVRLQARIAVIDDFSEKLQDFRARCAGHARGLFSR